MTDAVTDAARDRPYRGKRVLDLAVLAVIAVPALVVALPCAVAVRLTSRGPILFRQTRVGWGGRPFQMVKFRTMAVGDNPVIPDASRITSAGRWLRRTSLDELPNLLNVARGEMSIVGPRPTLAYQVARYDDRQRRRLACRPGLTGLAQVRGRNALSWTERIDYDLEYVDTQSVGLDLRILVATVGVLASGAGVEGHAEDDPLSGGPPEQPGRWPPGPDDPLDDP